MQPDRASLPRPAELRRSASEVISVYDNGTVRVGTLIEVGRETFAFDAAGDPVGVFRKRQDASRAIPPINTTEGAQAPSCASAGGA